MLKLFKDVFGGDLFYFYDKPNRKLIKSNDTHYIAPEGRRQCNPGVLVFTGPHVPGKSFYDNIKGDSNGNGNEQG